MKTSIATNLYEEAVKAAIPGASIDATMEVPNLHITAVFEAVCQAQAHERVYAALSAAGLNDKFDIMKLNWFRSRLEWSLTEAKKLVGYALMPLSSQPHGMSYFIHAKSNGYTLTIKVERLDGISSSQTREKITSLSESLLALTGLKKLSLDIESDSPSLFLAPAWPSMFALPSFNADDSDYPDDDDDMNPNWPSTTGNPSGGGRGNN